MRIAIRALAVALLAIAAVAQAGDATAKDTKSYGHGIIPIVSAKGKSEVDGGKIDPDKYRVEKLQLGSIKQPKAQEALMDWAIVQGKETVFLDEGKAQKTIRFTMVSLSADQAKNAGVKDAGRYLQITTPEFDKDGIQHSAKMVAILDWAKLAFKFQALPLNAAGLAENNEVFRVKTLVKADQWAIVSIGQSEVMYVEPLDDKSGDTAKDKASARNKDDAPLTLVVHVWSPKPAEAPKPVEPEKPLTSGDPPPEPTTPAPPAAPKK